MKNSIATFLSFNKNAEEAIRFYVTTFEKAFGKDKGESKIVKITYFGAEEMKALENMPQIPKDSMPGPAGAVKNIRFLLKGQELLAINGGGYFGKFHESMSLYVNCENQQQIDIIYEALAKGGELQRCGWVKDRFGVSWQITPDFLYGIDESDDVVRSQEVMKALYKMNKIDIATIKKIWSGEASSRLV